MRKRKDQSQRVDVMAWEDGGEPVAPDVFHRRQDAQFVDHHHVLGREALFHVVEFLFLVDVEERVAVQASSRPERSNLCGWRTHQWSAEIREFTH